MNDNTAAESAASDDMMWLSVGAPGDSKSHAGALEQTSESDGENGQGGTLRT